MMMELSTFTDVAGGTIVLFGVYAAFRLLRLVANAVIFLIALIDAMAACSLHLWHDTMVRTFDFLPPDLDFKGWAACVGLLILLGVVAALPIIPFSSVIRNMYAKDPDRHRSQPGSTHQLQAYHNTYPEDKLYRWDNINDA